MTTPIEEPLVLPLPQALAEVLDGTPELASARLVGGCVRDAVLGETPKDFDIEVYGIGYEALAAALARWGRADLVGRSFGVVKLALASGDVVDFSVPRRDSKTGAGHRGFAIDADPALSPRDAAARRDFTFNALAWDPYRGVVIDHFGGLADLRARVLRHTSEAFTEDPLRVLRGMQFAARFELAAAPETIALARSIVGTHAELALDRVREEWFKWAGRARRPSSGMRFLEACGWLEHYPELAAMAGTPQDPQWHPEGDVWTHTLHALDALAGFAAWREADEAARVTWMLAVLLHDTGKPATTTREMRAGVERVVSPGHESVGAELAERFLARIGAPGWTATRVRPLVAEHMAHLQCRTDRSVRRLARRLEPETIASLTVVIDADVAGRPPLPANPPETLANLRALAERLRLTNEAPKPILLGRHLLERGWHEGPALGAQLAAAFEAQLDGEFADLDGALAWLAKHGRRPD